MANKSPNRNPDLILGERAAEPGSAVPGIMYAVCISVLLAAGVMVYSNTLNCPFIFDDTHNIVQNSFIRMHEFSPTIFQNLAHCPCKARPVANFSFALNYYFHRYHVFGYHAVNILIHVLTGILLFLFSKTTYAIHASSGGLNPHPRDLLLAPFFGALLWLMHPVNTEAVTYIVQRMTSLAAMFYILSLLLYAVGRNALQKKTASGIRHQSPPLRAYICFVGCVVSGLLAIGSKEIAATLPVVILLYEWLFFQHAKAVDLKKLMICLAALAFFALIAVVLLGKNPVENILFSYEIQAFTVMERLLTEARIVVYYISLFFYPDPLRLNIEYDYPLSHALFVPLQTPLAVSAILGMVILAGYTIKRNRLMAFCGLWYLGNLLIESSIIPIELVFEHRLYLPFMMPAFLFSHAIFHVFKNKRWAVFLLSLLVVFLSYWTYQRNTIWRDETTAWTDCVKKSPYNSRPLSSLGAAYGKAGNLDLALAYFQKALRLNPDLGQTYDSVGYTLYQQGKYPEAIDYIRKGLARKPNDPNMTFHLAAALKAYGKYDQAMDQYLKVIQLAPYDVEAYYDLGTIQYQTASFESAKSSFQKALSIDPSYAPARRMLGNLYLQLRQYDKAENQFNVMLKRNPRDFRAHNGLGDVHKARGNLNLAADCYRAALSINPDDADACNNLGTVFIMQEKNDQAMDYLSRAITIDPHHPDAHINLGYILAQRHQYEEARRHFAAVLERDPDNLTALINMGTLMANQNRMKEAVDVFSRVLQIDPGNRFAKHSLENLPPAR